LFHDAVRRRVESGFGDAGMRMHDGKSKMTREEKISLLAAKDSKKLLWSEFTKCVLDF
jgi:hypothetical protein